MKKDEKSLYEEARRTWGFEAQLGMVYEEIGELLQVINKVKRGKNNLEDLAEEIADVGIMLEQLTNMYGISSYVLEMRYKKLERLEKMLEEER